jgi:hypothetical protein
MGPAEALRPLVGAHEALTKAQGKGVKVAREPREEDWALLTPEEILLFEIARSRHEPSLITETEDSREWEEIRKRLRDQKVEPDFRRPC